MREHGIYQNRLNSVFRRWNLLDYTNGVNNDIWAQEFDGFANGFWVGHINSINRPFRIKNPEMLALVKSPSNARPYIKFSCQSLDKFMSEHSVTAYYKDTHPFFPWAEIEAFPE